MAGVLAGSPLFRRGKMLWDQNSRDWHFPLSKLDKLRSGLWLILHDYSKGIFPPQFLDQQKAYEAEKQYRFAIPGMSGEEAFRNSMIKPFCSGGIMRLYLSHFSRLTLHLEQVGIRPPAKILELGCGGGWMAEFLATVGYDICATTLAESDVIDANGRIQSLEAKGLSPALKFVAAPMESVHTAVEAGSFDAVFVYEALHHAFDWRAALHSSFACLKKGGWFLICDEPNVLHTCASYRVAKLSNTHEIGFSKSELIRELRKTGFQKIISTGPKLHWWFRGHWLLAQK